MQLANSTNTYYFYLYILSSTHSSYIIPLLCCTFSFTQSNINSQLILHHLIITLILLQYSHTPQHNTTHHHTPPHTTPHHPTPQHTTTHHTTPHHTTPHQHQHRHPPHLHRPTPPQCCRCRTSLVAPRRVTNASAAPPGTSTTAAPGLASSLSTPRAAQEPRPYLRQYSTQQGTRKLPGRVTP